MGLGSSNCPPVIISLWICWGVFVSYLLWCLSSRPKKVWARYKDLEDVTQSTEILATAYLANIHIRPYNICIWLWRTNRAVFQRNNIHWFDITNDLDKNLLTTWPKRAYCRQGLGWDLQARIQFGRVRLGVFSMSCFVPPALSSDSILLIKCWYSLIWEG